MSRGAAAGLLVAGLWACVAPPPPAERPAVEMAELNWLDIAADPVAHLTLQPATCLTAPNDLSVQRGALLFASPMLLGGQAAKAGLSCAACHRNGRAHPNFFFSGISGVPGTADVTHGLFSSVRADGTFNPLPIPDLAAPEGRTRVDRDETGVLEAFLTAQIEEEFSGDRPHPVVVADLATYIRALDDRACMPAVSEPQSWQTELTLLRAGLTRPGPPHTADIDAMRAALGRLHARYPGPENIDLRTELVRLSRALADGTDRGALTTDFDTLATSLAAAEAQSLYDAVRLRQALR